MSKTKRSRGEKKTSIPVVTSIFDKLQDSCAALQVNLNLQSLRLAYASGQSFSSYFLFLNKKCKMTRRCT